MEASDLGALVVGGIASIWDLRTRRIPNLLTFGASLLALVFHAVSGGVSGGLGSLAGCAAGLALFFPFFALGGLGAGDVKLLGALGAWMGARDILWVALYSMVAGGVLALAVALGTGYARTAFTNLWVLLGYWRIAGLKPLPELTLRNPRAPRVAYAVPIALGSVAVVWLR